MIIPPADSMTDLMSFEGLLSEIELHNDPTVMKHLT